MNYDPLDAGLLTSHAETIRTEADAMAASERLAASLIRRSVLRHPCRGADCRHRNHRRDLQHEALLRDAILRDPGSTPYAEPGDYEQPVTWASLTKTDALMFKSAA